MHGTTRDAQQDRLGFTRSDAGAIRARGYGRTTGAQMRELLGAAADEDVFVTGVTNGVRTTSVLGSGPVAVKPGDSFVGGPKCQLAALAGWFGQREAPARGPAPPADPLARHLAGLRELGFGQIAVERSARGIRVRLRGFTLPGGARTDLLVVLPPQFPALPPIGFYLRRDAPTGGLDLGHLFPDRAHHGAADLSAEPEGWRWYCLIVPNWNPARHTLAGFVGQISAQLAAGRRR